DGDESGDDARFRRGLPQPARAQNEAAESEIEDAGCNGNRDQRDKPHVDAAKNVLAAEEGKAEAKREVIEGDQREGEEAPEDEGVSDAGDGPLGDDFGLKKDFPDEIGDAPREIAEGETGIRFCGRDDRGDSAETSEKKPGRGGN